jgi:pyruvate dehydrogenase E2 component (dihydrolipoamide acetyltransferase)
VAILGITKTEMTPIWDGQEFRPKPMISLDLSYDHRVINGADATRFMTYLVSVLAEPRRMLV